MNELERLYERVLLNEYSEGFKKQQVARLQKQARNITPAAIKAAIERFDEIKTNQGSFNSLTNLINGDAFQKKEGDTDKDKARKEKIKSNPRELTLYNWSDIDYLILHNFEDVKARSAAKKAAKTAGNTATVQAKQLSTTPGLNIYLGANAQECIELNKWFWKKNRDKILENEGIIKPIVGDRRWTDEIVYYWCIGWPGVQNRFEFYRFASTPASAYYVEDTTLPVTDPHHIIVVHAQSDGRFRATDAFNDHKTESIVTWDTLVNAWQPKLAGFKKEVIFHPFSNIDANSEKMFSSIRPETFMTLGTFELKKGYIIRRNRILKKDYLQIVPALQKEYIDIQCHPSINDRSRTERFGKMMFPFSDKTQEDVQRVKDEREQVKKICMELTDEEYNNLNTETVFKLYAPILEGNITIKEGSPQAYKLWRKFVIELCEVECDSQKSERRGYATV